jgi:hypothetical protein
MAIGAPTKSNGQLRIEGRPEGLSREKKRSGPV